MTSNRREFMQVVGTGSAGLAIGAEGLSPASAEASAAGKEAADGPVLLVGDDDRRRRHAARQGARLRAPRHPLLPRDPVRRRHVGREPLHAAAEAEAVDGRLPRAVVGQHRAPEHGEAVRQPVLRVPRPLELRRRQRGLPADQRLHAGAQRREEAAGARLAPRRRLRQRQRHRARRLQRREPRPARRRGLLLDQPPARPARLLRPGRRRRGEVRRVRQRRHARLRRRARVGARQHRGLRRRPRQRDDHGPVRRRREGLRADRDAGGEGPLPQGGGAERRLAQDGREGLRREARRGRPRRGRPRARATSRSCSRCRGRTSTRSP